MINIRENSIKDSMVINSRPKNSFFAAIPLLQFVLLFGFIGFLCISAIFDLLPGKPAILSIKILAGIIFVITFGFSVLSGIDTFKKIVVKKIQRMREGVLIESRFASFTFSKLYKWNEIEDVTFSYENKFKPFDLLLLINGKPKVIDVSLNGASVDKSIKAIESWLEKNANKGFHRKA